MQGKFQQKLRERKNSRKFSAETEGSKHTKIVSAETEGKQKYRERFS